MAKQAEAEQKSTGLMGWISKLAPIPDAVKEAAQSYKEKPQEQSAQSWLGSYLEKKLIKEETREKIGEFKSEILEGIDDFNQGMKDIEDCTAQGYTNEIWLAQKLIEKAPGKDMQEKGAYLQQLHSALRLGNAQLLEWRENGKLPAEIPDDYVDEEASESVEWNRYNIKELATEISNQVRYAGLSNLALSGSDAETPEARVVREDELQVMGNTEETTLPAESQEHGSFQIVAAGAVNLAARKLPFLRKFAPFQKAVTNIACAGTEVCRAAYHVATGKSTVSKAIDHTIKATSVAFGSCVEAGVHAVAAKQFPVANVIGTKVVENVAKTLNTSMAKGIYNGLKKIKNTVEPLLHKTANKVEAVGKKILNKIFG